MFGPMTATRSDLPASQARRPSRRHGPRILATVGLAFLTAMICQDAGAQDSLTAGCDALACRDLQGCGSDVQWLSLPAHSNITRAEELFDFVPGAVRVTKRFPVIGGAESYTWDGLICTLPDGSEGIEPDADLCGSNCFCIQAGQGFEVASSDPRRINIFGDDADTLLELRANQSYLISLPQNSFIRRARALLAILPDGSRVTRMNCDGTLTHYFTGASPSQNFDIQPGEAYEVVPGADGPVELLEGGVAPVPCQKSYRYEIVGTSEEIPYSWGVDSSSLTPGFEAENWAAPPVSPAGAGPFRLADALADDINLQHGQGVTADADLTRPDQGWICVASEDELPQLYVGHVDQEPDCNANFFTCTYNPTIQLGTVPVTDLWLVPGEFSWTPIGESYDLVWGDLSLLLEVRGDFTTTVEACLADDAPDASWPDDTGKPNAGRAFWYLVRVNDARGPHSYDSRRPGQLRPRDRSIDAAPGACPGL